MSLLLIRHDAPVATNYSAPTPTAAAAIQSTDYCDLKMAGLWDGPIPDRGPQALAAIWALFAAATIFVALRFYCKMWRYGRKGLWWDDLFMGVTWVSFVLSLSLSLSSSIQNPSLLVYQFV